MVSIKKIYLTGWAILTIGQVTLTDLRAQVKPDLIVRSAVITKDASGLYVSKIRIIVMNICGGSMAGTSYVLVTFKTSAAKDAKAIYYIGNKVKAIKGGESYAQTFDVSEKKISVGTHIFVEADPYKKIAEANEDNNWRSLNPNDDGTILSQPRCSRKM